MEFTLNGHRWALTAHDVERLLADVVPERVQTHGVVVSGTTFPVKQALGVATGMGRTEFTSHTARRLLSQLGFSFVGETQTRGPQPRPSAPPGPLDPHAWPWEGEVQRVFSTWLEAYAWTIASAADTATKAHGVDVIATKGGRVLGAEVKGWPSRGYADPRRAEETKRTQPTNQAGHWYSQGLMKAMMLLNSHPGYESLVVLPDYPRYRDLASRTSVGRASAGIHVVFMAPNGAGASDSWCPDS
jgi:hypothetical protein